MERLSIQFLASHLWFWALLLLPATALAFWAYYRILAPLSRPARWALWVLRGAAFALVLLALWQPIVTAEIREGGKPALAVLLDRSARWGLRGGGEAGGSRDAQVREVRRKLREGLADRFRVEDFAFAEHIRPLPADSALPSPRGATALGQALEELISGAGARPVNGLLVVSDGVNTAGRDPVRVAAAAAVPVFTVAVGTEDPIEDAEIRAVRTNPTAFLGEPLPIRAVVSSSGLGGRRARVEVRQSEAPLASADIQLLGESGLEQEVLCEIRPAAPGWNLFEVRLTGVGDSIPQNDRRLLAVQVLERKTRVLVLAGRLDWDYAFLRRTLAADTTLGYSFLVQTRPGIFAAQGEGRLRRLPESVADLREFAAVVASGFDERGLPPASLEALARFVREGGGLLLLGGSARAGGWTSQGPFGAVLPAALSAGNARGERALPVVLTLEGQRHPATSVRDNPADAAREWSLLPPVQCPGGTLAPRADAKVLLEYRLPRGPGEPALVAAFSDRGKAAWLHARGIWRWDLQAAGAAEPTDLFPQFCLALVRWIAEPAVRDRFQADPVKRVFQDGEPLGFHASVWSENYAPVAGAAVSVSVRAAGSMDAEERRLDLRAGAETGGYEGETSPLPPGEYLFRASAAAGDSRPLGQAEGRFWVEEMGPEFARTRSDREGLAQMARRSGGDHADASELGPLLEKIPRSVHRVGRLHEWEVWNHWALFAAFLAVLSVEWFLRRRRGLA